MEGNSYRTRFDRVRYKFLMRAPYDFIVRPVGGKRYDNTKDIGGFELIVSTSEEDHKHSNRFAEVVAIPINFKGDIKKGDILLVHHNVFKFYSDQRGRQRSGRSYFKDDLFFIDVDQFFMYFNGTEWMPYDRYCFVKPIEVKEDGPFSPISELPLTGIMKYPNKMLIDSGVNKGDKVNFTPNSEYEFNIDGERLYRLFDHHITMVV